MTENELREKVIKAFELCLMPPNKEEIENDICSHEDCPYYREYNGGKCISAAASDALALLKEHEQATIEPKRIDLPDETKAWLDKMDAVDALGNIANICMDWDGYRTANGLGGLINEIWAYARYCADRLQKAQEPKLVTNIHKEHNNVLNPNVPWVGKCPKCGKKIEGRNLTRFCKFCGQAVKWDAQEQRDYEAAVEMAEYCERYEPTYNADDGSM